MEFNISGKKRSRLVEKFQRNILFWDIKVESSQDMEGKGVGYCSNMGSRTCLTCDKCWGMRGKALGK